MRAAFILINQEFDSIDTINPEFTSLELVTGVGYRFQVYWNDKPVPAFQNLSFNRAQQSLRLLEILVVRGSIPMPMNQIYDMIWSDPSNVTPEVVRFRVAREILRLNKAFRAIDPLFGQIKQVWLQDDPAYFRETQHKWRR